jgi:hypothetical protein
MEKIDEQITTDKSAIIGHRLITYNLLNSALACTKVEPQIINMVQIEDLCTFIDLFCLYDGVVLLGHNWKWDSPNIAKRNELAAALVEANFITEKEHRLQGHSNLDRAHAKHLAAFLGQDMDNFSYGLPSVGNGLSEDYVEFSMGHDDYGQVAYPTDLRDWYTFVDLGSTPDVLSNQMRQICTAPKRSDLVAALAVEAQQNQRMHKFIMRTFVYIAYADVQRIPFTPDTTRHSIVDGIFTEEDQFRGRLQSILKSVVSETTPGDKALLRRIPPIAAVLFERAQTRCDIAKELIKLRKELTSLRDTLKKLEHKLYYESRDTAMKAAEKWNRAVEEVERNFGLEPRFIAGKMALQLGMQLGDVIDNPTKFKSWWSAITELPSEVIKRLISRHTLIELHRLRPELPASEKLRKTIRKIFRDCTR